LEWAYDRFDAENRVDEISFTVLTSCADGEILYMASVVGTEF
jgi:hypothetical protein